MISNEMRDGVFEDRAASWAGWGRVKPWEMGRGKPR